MGYGESLKPSQRKGKRNDGWCHARVTVNSDDSHISVTSLDVAFIPVSWELHIACSTPLLTLDSGGTLCNGYGVPQTDGMASEHFSKSGGAMLIMNAPHNIFFGAEQETHKT